VHPKVVSERLGHSSISVTLDTYSHAVAALQAVAAESVANLLQQARAFSEREPS
jgi:integrase